MRVRMDYGRNGLWVEVPDHADVFLVRETTGIADEVAEVQIAIQNPIQSPPLGSLVRAGMKVAVAHTDITRATPNDRLLPVILKELEKSGVSRKDIVLLNGLGTHRPQTRDEMTQMLGADLVKDYLCLQHDAYDDAGLVSLGQTERGHPISLNRNLIEADFKILTGFIEPHFFAGFSGGPKAILPALAGAESIFANHSPAMIAHPKATFNITHGNPVWEEMKEVALKVENTFLVNVTLDRENKITNVFAGDLITAHAQGCNFVKSASEFEIPDLYDVVITTNSGYPLDQNLYQCVKGLAAARRAVRKGGAILLLAACEEGLPDNSAYAKILKQAGGPAAVLDRIAEADSVWQDSWQAQIQSQVQMEADVYLSSEGLNITQVKTALLNPCTNPDRDIQTLMERYGQRVCVLPQGPLTILSKS